MTPDDHDKFLGDGLEQPECKYPGLPEGAPQDLKRSYSIGKTLCIILDKATEFESTKKRRRMVQDIVRRPMTPLRLYKVVLETVKDIRTAQPAPRPASKLKRLKELQESHLQGTLDYSSIDEWLWYHLGAFELDDQEDLISKPKLLALRLDEAILEWEGSLDHVIDKRGGRRPDPRLDSLLHRLAFLYREYTGFRATYSISYDTAKQQSPFFHFADTVLKLFFTSGAEANWRKNPGAIQGAIRRISKFERESDPMSDEELDHTLSRSV